MKEMVENNEENNDHKIKWIKVYASCNYDENSYCTKNGGKVSYDYFNEQKNVYQVKERYQKISLYLPTSIEYRQKITSVNKQSNRMKREDSKKG